jgi:hypothetical protein
MLVVYKFEKSGQQTVAPIPYCFHIALPVRTGPTTFRNVRICVNTASLSPPTDSSSISSRGYFYADPKDRIITLEVKDNNWIQVIEETAELYVPARTFLAYIAASAFVSTEPASPRPVAGTSGPVVDVPWEEWGPYGAHLVRATDQTHIVGRPRVCGMRVLGAPLSKKSVAVTDYHPGRVARSVTATVDASSASVSMDMDGEGTFSDSAAAAARIYARASIPAPVPTQLPVGVGTSSSDSETRSATGTTALTRMPRCFPRLVCTTKEVPLPPELQKASESPWTMLCEDALLAFEVSRNIIIIVLRVSCSAEWTMFSTFSMHSTSRTASISAGYLHIRSDKLGHVTHWRTSTIDNYLLPISIDY